MHVWAFDKLSRRLSLCVREWTSLSRPPLDTFLQIYIYVYIKFYMYIYIYILFIHTYFIIRYIRYIHVQYVAGCRVDL